MAPANLVTPPPAQRNRMLLVVLGTGAAVGLHLGLLHLFMWKSAIVPIPFFVGSLCFATVTYCLWRWAFPRLPSGSFVGQIAAQMAVSIVAYGILSVGVTTAGAYLLGAPGLFGAPTGVEEHLTITPARRQAWVQMYVLLPIVPSMLTTIIMYHLVWRRMETLQTRARELRELAATAQLAALRAQINPHFLFNSLNSIAQLIHVDPDKAEACVERLAEIFRYLLQPRRAGLRAARRRAADRRRPTSTSSARASAIA